MDMKIKDGVAIVSIADRQVEFEAADLELTSRGHVRSGEWHVLTRSRQLRAEVVKIS